MTGRDLRTIREACGVTMGDLAREIGWAPFRVSDFESGVWAAPGHNPDAAYITALARIVRARTPVAVLDGAQ